MRICRSCCTPAANTTLTLHVHGCGGAGYGAGVTVAPHAGGSTLASFTVPSGGTASASFSLASNTSVDITATPSGTGSGRFAATTVGTVTLTAGATNSVTLSLSPATGYRCLCVCVTPVLETLSLIVTPTPSGSGCTAFPSDTLTYGAPPAWAAGTGGSSSVWWGSQSFSALASTGGYSLAPCAGFPDTLIFYPVPNVSGSYNLMYTSAGTIACLPFDVKAAGINPSNHGGTSFNFSSCTYEIKE